jgi:hypothetical protein
MTHERQDAATAEPRAPVRSFADAVDRMGARDWAEGIILEEADLAAEFFDLRSGLAGELFQKCVNYGLRAAIVLPNPESHGQRFGELAYEHRSHPVVRVVSSRAHADAWLQAARVESRCRA